jgi:hypothetical protein
MPSGNWTVDDVRQLEADLRAAAEDDPNAEELLHQLEGKDTAGKISYLELRDSLVNLDITSIISTENNEITDVEPFDPWLLDWKKRHGKE